MEKKEIKKKKPFLKVFFQLFLLITFSFAVSYLLDKAYVSAATSSSVSTCLMSNNNDICQEYSSDVCDSECTSSCIPSARDQVSECQLGSCLDESQGLCSLNVPKKTCEDSNGKWINDPNGNAPECKKGCCILGDQTIFTTSQRCSIESGLRGLSTIFKPEIESEINCISLSESQEKGACVYESSDQIEKNTCKFLTKSDCKESNGNFYSGILCSNPDLNTNCERQSFTQCVQNKDEIYWFDSCGNPENIYDANKEKSYNSGKVLSKEESCQIPDSENNKFSLYQETCGNCNYLLGSRCGDKTSSESLSDPLQSFVCRDLSCIDANGKKRSHGESWCEYQGSTGVEDNQATDTPGSIHFRKTCVNGNIETESCGDYRNKICVETQTPLPSGDKFSSAACRTNLWQQCLSYNGDGKINEEKCITNPDCFVKEVYVTDKFKFNYCVPKYSEGFDLYSNPDGAQSICNIGTQTCKYIKVKSLFSSTTINAECLTDKFTTQMNDFCTSLGDCGGSVNYIGQYSDSYEIENAPELSQSYISKIAKFAEVKKGQYIEAPDLNSYYGSLGIPGWLGTATSPEGQADELFKSASMVSGVMGIAILGAAKLGLIPSAIPVLGPVMQGEAALAPIVPALTAVAGALAGAAIAVGVVTLLMQLTGAGKYMSEAEAYAIIGLAAVAGALIGLKVVGVAIGIGFTLGIIGLVIAIVLIILEAIFGGKKEIDVTFTCKPWQPPIGGDDCSKCGEGQLCSKYSCESLGTACELINEGTENQECTSISKDDASPPVISAITDKLPEGYSYETFENGIKIKSSEEDGCIKETYTEIPFGISLDEPSQCGMTNIPGQTYDQMYDFSGESLFLKEHYSPIYLPSLESLGLEKYDPNIRADFSLYVKCRDRLGNENPKDYSINFCIKQGTDIVPAIITGKSPNLEYVSYEASEQNITLFTNEPAECKFSLIDKEYTEMENEMSCLTDLYEKTLNGWPCTSSFPIIGNQSNYYVRCLDQPWLLTNDSKRNSNQQSFVLELKRSISPLVISKATPDNQVLSFSTTPVSIEVNVETSGGLDGTSRCYYYWKNGTGIEFYQGAWTSNHKQVFESVSSGKIVLPIMCEDKSGNRAEKSLSFEIKADSEAPLISRAYSEGNSLLIITNEPAECSYKTSIVYSTDNCNFDFSEGEQISGLSLSHSISEFSNYYYVKCKDKFGNTPGGCSIILKKSLEA